MNLRPLDPQVSVKPCSPVPARPSRPADLQQSSQCICLRPTMFRAACDNSVTTSQPASPPTANLSISKCPPASQICTKPDRSNRVPCPTTARQRLIATHHDTPSIRIPPPAAPAVSFHCANSPLSSLRPATSVHIPPRPPHRFTAPDPDMSKVTTCAAHTARSPTLPMPGLRRRPIPSHRRRR